MCYETPNCRVIYNVSVIRQAKVNSKWNQLKCEEGNSWNRSKINMIKDPKWKSFDMIIRNVPLLEATPVVYSISNHVTRFRFKYYIIVSRDKSRCIFSHQSMSVTLMLRALIEVPKRQMKRKSAACKPLRRIEAIIYGRCVFLRHSKAMIAFFFLWKCWYALTAVTVKWMRSNDDVMAAIT